MSDTTNTGAEFDEDIFDSMLHGTFDENSVEADDVEEEDVEGTETFDEDDSEDQEDTDQEEDSDVDEELDEDDDGDLDEDLEDEDDDEEEDTLVDDYDSDDEDGDTEDEEEDSDEEDEPEVEEDIDEESEDETDTEDSSDGEGQDTDEVDYKAFYDAVVNTEFTVNGKKVKGFADPKKIIQSQQMAGGFSEKMAGFKQYRPYMAPLKDRGMLDDPAKFDLAMNLIDGDKEAIKAHLKSLNLDPMDLDMDEITYEPKQATASEDSLVIEDTLERARSAGIEDRVRQVIGNEWDPESFQEFVHNPAVRDDLLTHMETGVYDAVQDKMLELSRLDYNGAYGNMTTINKYRTAVAELQKENANRAPAQESTTVPKVDKSKQVKAEKAKIAKARKEEEYREKAAKREAKLTQQRKRAASMSKKKPKAKPKPKFDPLTLEGDELEAHLDFLIAGGRG